jgi:hypothetical protein
MKDEDLFDRINRIDRIGNSFQTKAQNEHSLVMGRAADLLRQELEDLGRASRKGAFLF